MGDIDYMVAKKLRTVKCYSANTFHRFIALVP